MGLGRGECCKCGYKDMLENHIYEILVQRALFLLVHGGGGGGGGGERGGRGSPAEHDLSIGEREGGQDACCVWLFVCVALL